MNGGITIGLRRRRGIILIVCYLGRLSGVLKHLRGLSSEIIIGFREWGGTLSVIQNAVLGSGHVITLQLTCKSRMTGPMRYLEISRSPRILTGDVTLSFFRGPGLHTSRALRPRVITSLTSAL